MPSKNLLERTLSQSDLLLGRACSAVISIVPSTVDILNYDVDLGPLVPEWAAADARKSPAINKVETSMLPPPPVA